MVELDENVRMGLLVGATAIVLFVLINMTGIVFGGDKLFLIDMIGIGDQEAFRPITGFSTQDIVGLMIAAVMGALYFMSAEDDLDWEALLGDDDDDDEEE